MMEDSDISDISEIVSSKETMISRDQRAHTSENG